jgi:hypothetical protein
VDGRAAYNGSWKQQVGSHRLFDGSNPVRFSGQDKESIMSDMICVKTFDRRFEAEIAKSLLEENGIQALVAVDDAGGIWPDLGYTTGGARLCVMEEHTDEAIALLQSQPMPESADVEEEAETES